MVSRRMVLVAGSGAALLTVAGGTWGLTRTPRLAIQPWTAASFGFGAPLLDCLGYAILAPNPHNMQPWRINVLDDSSFELFINPERLLPHTDPPSRQITIGMGCFLEVFRIAAAERGYATVWSTDSEGAGAQGIEADQPIARVEISRDPEVRPDPLFEHILQRRTTRSPYDLSRPVDPGLLETVAQAASPEGGQMGGSVENESVEALRELTSRAWSIEWNNEATRRESIDVTRIGKAEVNAKPWGLSLSGPMLEALGFAGILTRETMDDPDHQAFTDSERFYAQACETAMGHLWMVTENNRRVDQLNAGVAWVRAHLKATEIGLGFHPLSQALQEFDAMSVPYREIHDRLAPQGGVIQMLVRVGYASAPGPAPREKLEMKLVSA